MHSLGSASGLRPPAMTGGGDNSGSGDVGGVCGGM